jgi:hypothetical protein
LNLKSHLTKDIYVARAGAHICPFWGLPSVWCNVLGQLEGGSKWRSLYHHSCFIICFCLI